MKTLQELQKEIAESEEEYGIPECSLTDLMYRELKSQNDVALTMFLEICIDFCNCYDRLDLMEEIWEAMIDGDYHPTYNAFQSYLVETMNDGELKYIPQDEDELNAVIDKYQVDKQQSKEFENYHIKEYGVEWLTATGVERMRMIIDKMRKDGTV